MYGVHIGHELRILNELGVADAELVLQQVHLVFLYDRKGGPLVLLSQKEIAHRVHRIGLKGLVFKFEFHGVTSCNM